MSEEIVEKDNKISISDVKVSIINRFLKNMMNGGLCVDNY